MKTIKLTTLRGLVLAGLTASTHAAPFDSGSTGADGALNVTNDITLQLPPNGVFNFTSITIDSGMTLRFGRNEFNTPVYLLASSNVTITGVIDVSGYPAMPSVAGQGGPGGFDGGNPSSGGEPPGDGYGPGGGQGGQAQGDAKAGAFGTTTSYSSSNRYGNTFLQPMVGGSGGGGTTAGNGGGGGGGAILVASSTEIRFQSGSVIRATGGTTGDPFSGGSGGAIRLVAPRVVGSSTLDANGAQGGTYGGGGRIRVDTLDRTQMALTMNARSSVGANMIVFPSPLPRLDIVEVAGRAIPFGTNGAVRFQLPLDAPTNQTVKVQATDFIGQVSLEVAITPDNGPAQRFSGSVDLAATNRATATVNVIIPPDVPCRVNAWTR